MEEFIAQAVNVLSKGGIVIFPTDTAFGIGCLIDEKKAVQKLFAIRKRPETQATPVLVDSLEMAQAYLLPIPENVTEDVIKAHWPGALTLVLPCRKEKVPSLVRGGGENLGVRMPNHAVTLEIIKKVGVPILGPSANFHGEKTPYTFTDLNPALIKLADYVVPGECTIQQASTVVDCSVQPIKILRQGAITVEI